LRILPILLAILISTSSLAYGNIGGEGPTYEFLMNRLAQDGFDLDYLAKLFADPRAELIPAAMTLSLGSKEVQDIYNQFLTPQSILSAKKFLQANLKLLRQMESQFHVDKEVVVAILFVESRFGENIGRHRVIPTLASMALTDAPENLWSNYLLLWEIDPELSFEWLEERAKRKANWAYHELKCFLRIIRDEKIDPLEIRGSYAGALGMAQFMPSSYLAYAHTKESLDTWLLSKEAAVYSIANYLKSHGWKKNLTLEKKKRSLWYYNRSEPYVETILEIAKRIK
jgi:membrane-bound lytic murein transglycosylase B